MLGKTKTRGQTKGRGKTRGRGRGRTQRQQGGKPGYRIDGSKIPVAPKRTLGSAMPMQQMQPTQQMQLGQQPYRSRGRTQRRGQRRS